MKEDYRDSLLRPPAPPVDVTPAEALALALGWQPVYAAPLAPPARWIAPDGTPHTTLPDWEALLAEVAYWRGEVAHYQTAAATLLARVSALETVLRETIPLLAYAQDLADEAYKQALGTKYYQLRQQIAALFPPD